MKIKIKEKKLRIIHDNICALSTRGYLDLSLRSVIIPDEMSNDYEYERRRIQAVANRDAILNVRGRRIPSILSGVIWAQLKI